MATEPTYEENSYIFYYNRFPYHCFLLLKEQNLKLGIFFRVHFTTSYFPRLSLRDCFRFQVHIFKKIRIKNTHLGYFQHKKHQP